MGGITEEQFAEFGLTFGVAAFMLYALALAMPIYFQIVIDKVLTHKGLATLQVLSFGMLAALAFEAGFSYLRGIVLLHAAARIDVRVAARTFARLTALPLRFFGHSRVGVPFPLELRTARA